WKRYPPKYKRERDVRTRRRAVRLVAQAIAAIDGFDEVVQMPTRGATHRELDRACDVYDALLALIAGIAAVDRAACAWEASVAGEVGSILAIADDALRRRFSEACARRLHPGECGGL